MTTRRSFLTLTLCGWWLFASTQEIQLVGRASIFNSRYKTGRLQYVKDAYVMAPFTKAANSDDSGRFSLVFVGMDAGTPVKVQVEKAGLEVVNAYDLQQVVIGRKLPLPVYLSPKGELVSAQTELYNISKKVIDQRSNEMIARLRAGETAAKAAIAELEQRFGQAIKDRYEAEQLVRTNTEKLVQRLPEFAQALAAQNLDFASDLYIKAYNQYRNGEIENAIKLLDDAKLNQFYKEGVAGLKEGKRLENIAKNIQEKSLQQIDQAVNGFELKARSFELLFKYDSAARLYEQLIRICKDNDLDRLKLAGYYEMAALAYYVSGKDEKALENEQNVLNIKSPILGPMHPGIATAYAVIGLCYSALGEYTKALEYQQKCINIRESILSANAPDLAEAYSNIAFVYADLEKYDSALLYQQKDLHICEQLRDSLQLSVSYTTISKIYAQAGAYQKALEYQLNSIAIQERTPDPYKLDLANSYDNLASIYSILGQFPKAVPIAEKGIAIAEKVLGTQHPHTAHFYGNLATIYANEKVYDLSLQYNLKAVSILEENLPPHHDQFGILYNNIADVYEKLGAYDKALEYFRKSLDIVTINLPPTHILLGNDLLRIAVLYQDLAQDEKALEYQQKGIAIIEANANSQNPVLGGCYDLIAVLYEHSGQYKKGLEYRQRSMEIEVRRLGPKHPSIARHLNNIAISYANQGLMDKALDYQQRAIALAREILPPQHPYLTELSSTFISLAHYYNETAKKYYDDQQFDSAHYCLQKSIGILERDFSVSDEELAIAYNYMALTCNHTQQQENALKYEKLFIALLEKSRDTSNLNFANGYSNMGSIYDSLGQKEKVVECYEKAIAFYEKVLPANARMLSMYFAMEQTCERFGQYEKALKYAQKSRPIAERLLDPNDINLANLYTNEGAILQELQQNEKGLFLQLKGLSIQEKKLPPYDPSLSAIYNFIAHAYDNLHKYDTALGYYKKSLTIDQHNLPASDTNLIDSYSNVAGCLYRLKDYPASIEYYKRIATLFPDHIEKAYYNGIGLAYVRGGQFPDAHSAFLEYEKLAPGAGQSYLNWFIYYALQHDKTNALDNLQKAVQAGYTDLEWIAGDDSLKEIRSEPLYTKIVKQSKNNPK